ncbi:probable LRR receptor-like serine/threonine-protein kinase At1g67720 [Phoenix dactylifera]|uniref:Probable LRR receptor-like serine/threonine-protein kinase At1g67720 n=1 Tax=Phoenix dactylifera TaxID=42345 RepID=A0A8B7BNV4_PHODC|nr:probable LRR receptor-like serine/threonine-protein kinase At1g67720 [Phoenix dactylifera]
MMSLSALLVLLLCLLTSVPPSLPDATSPPRGYFINCGASKEETLSGIRWTSDTEFISVGNVSEIKVAGVVPILSQVRYFPDKSARKYCFVFPVNKEGKYLVRTTYYYGGFDGGSEPPVFDQIIEGTKWSTVNTSAHYANGLTSYYEIIVVAQGKTLSVCLARNNHTVSSPFISAVELVNLEDSMYNSTSFSKYALSTVARHCFGSYGRIMSHPDDPFNRYWEPFEDENPVVDCHSNVSSKDFWNFPPAKAMQKALTTSRGKELVVKWPAAALPSAIYYVALYFQDNRTPSPFSWRTFDVSVNGKDFYKGLNVSTAGVMVFGTRWPLSGQTQITLTPHGNSPVGPLINAGEILQVVPLGGRTRTRDVIAMEELARRFDKPPPDWRGDPCLPSSHSWTGVYCVGSDILRVVKLDLTDHGISGTLPDVINDLTALTHIWLGGNKLSGSIPDMTNLNNLVSLRLSKNEFTGEIPPWLGKLESLKELHLQENKFTGKAPESLRGRSGLDLQLSSENQFDKS